MSNVNFFTNSYFHTNVEPVHLSQRVDTALTRNACSSIQPIIPVLPSNGFGVPNLWSFSNAVDATAQANYGTVSQENRGNEEATVMANPQPVYAWMKKKRGKAGKDDENNEGRNTKVGLSQDEVVFENLTRELRTISRINFDMTTTLSCYICLT